ncbi:MAG: phosphocholine cytidylyltransferase family protein [Calditrichales bacterium]|nr:MAG: phosphocholine cytidylyltransferase family protein [Calditrichales bacterium]
MKAVILAAGVASRLRPLTDNTPKCLLPVGKKTMLGRTLENLIQNGVNEFIIGTGYLQEQIVEFIRTNFPELKVTFVYNEKFDTTNNIFSLWLTREYLMDTPMILMDSDIIFDHRIIKQLLDAGTGSYLAVKSVHELGEEEMKLTVTADNRVLKISKEIDPKNAIGESIGIAKFDKDFVQALFKIVERRIFKAGKVNEFYEAAFQEAVDDGQTLFAVDVGNFLCSEIDTVEDMEHARTEIVPLLD